MHGSYHNNIKLNTVLYTVQHYTFSYHEKISRHQAHMSDWIGK